MGGYNPPTTDAWDLIKRRQAAERAATREALRVGGTQPFQTTRKTSQSIERLDEQAADIVAIVASIPITDMAEGVNSGWTPTGSWTTVASATVPRPVGKGTMKSHAMATVMIKLTSSGMVLPLLRLRVIIDGDAGAEMETRANLSISDGSGTRVFASGSAQNVHSRGGGGDVTASLQVYYGWIIPPEPGDSIIWSDAQAQVGMTVAFTP